MADGNLSIATPIGVADGGTGNTSIDAYEPVIGGTTGTGALQSVNLGTSGQVLTSNGAGAAPTFQNSSSFNVKDVQRYTWVYENFAGGGATQGSYIWSSSLSGGGVAVIDAETKHIGITAVDTSTSATGKALLRLGGNHIVLPSGLIEVSYVMKLPTLSDASETYEVELGITDLTASTGTVSDGIYFRYTHSENSGAWTAVSSKDGTSTSINSADTVDTDWHTLKFTIDNTAANVNFYIDGTEISNSPITTNIPGSGDFLHPTFRIVKSVGTTERSLYVDTVIVYMDVDG